MREGDDEERQALLPPEAKSAPSTTATPMPALASSSSTAGNAASGALSASPVGSTPAGALAASSSAISSDAAASSTCRICLEEDTPANLETPCSCTGTAKYVHKACLQKWVTEKGNLKCEICGQSYKGGYRVPPPRERQPPDDLPEHARFLFRERFMDVYDDDHARLRRQSGTSWCFSFFLFLILFSVMGQQTAPPADYNGGAPGAGGAAAPPAPAPPMPPARGPEDYQVTAGMILVWVLSKLFLVVLPMWTIMRIAVRQAAARNEFDDDWGGDEPAARRPAPRRARSNRQPGRPRANRDGNRDVEMGDVPAAAAAPVAAPATGTAAGAAAAAQPAAAAPAALAGAAAPQQPVVVGPDAV